MQTNNVRQRYKGWLMRTYPRTFDPRKRPPLMVGTYRALLADPARPPWATDATVQWALARWCRHWRYRRSVVWRMRRRTLDGTKLDQVTEAHATRMRSLQVRGQPSNGNGYERGASTGAPGHVFPPRGAQL